MYTIHKVQAIAHNLVVQLLENVLLVLGFVVFLLKLVAVLSIRMGLIFKTMNFLHHMILLVPANLMLENVHLECVN